MTQPPAWTAAERENAMRYGVCCECGAPRESKMLEKDGAFTLAVVCPNGHPQR